MERLGRLISNFVEELLPSSSTSDETVEDGSISMKFSVPFLKKTGFFSIEKSEIKNFTFVRRFCYACDLYKGYYNNKLVCVKEYNLQKIDDCKTFIYKLKEDIEQLEEFETNYHVGDIKGVYESNHLRVGIVSEYYTRNLENLILRSRELKVKISWERKVRMIHQIVLGMIELHSTNIIHRKLEAKNIVFDNDNNVKIINFVGTRFEEEQQQRSLKTKFFDSYYQSPEYTLSDTYGKPTDVYSFAIIIFEMLTQQIDPFGTIPCDIPLQVARRRIPLPELPAEYINQDSFWVVELMHECWKFLPEGTNGRPNFQQILSRLPTNKKKKNNNKKTKKK